MIDIHVFILCYNEEILINHTIKHYKHFLPNCNITILDNNSTDNSVILAKEKECKIITWGEYNEIDDYAYTRLKNNIWKDIKKGFVIVCDMDEWLCITQDELEDELKKGNTFINTHGIHMVSNSKCHKLSDVNLHKISHGVYWRFKTMCFYRPDIKETNFNIGLTKYNPVGNFKLSEKKYIFKHMDGYMGVYFYKDKMINRYLRRKNKTPANHYTNNLYVIQKNYNNFYLNKKYIKQIEKYLIE